MLVELKKVKLTQSIIKQLQIVSISDFKNCEVLGWFVNLTVKSKSKYLYLLVLKNNVPHIFPYITFSDILSEKTTVMTGKGPHDYEYQTVYYVNLFHNGKQISKMTDTIENLEKTIDEINKKIKDADQIFI